MEEFGYAAIGRTVPLQDLNPVSLHLGEPRLYYTLGMSDL